MSYGILINTADNKVQVIELPTEGDLGWEDIASLIDADYIELAHPTQGVDLWVDEEGLINGSVDEIGVFRIEDADGEILGQSMYAGNGLMLRPKWGEDGLESVGFDKETADKIVDSLTIRMGSPYEIAITKF